MNMNRFLFLLVLLAALCLISCNRKLNLGTWELHEIQEGDTIIGIGDVSGLGLSGIGVGGGGVSEGIGGLGSIGSTGSYGAAPSTETSRNEPIRRHLELIASSEDQEEVLNHMMEMLEMCESEQTTVKVFDAALEEEEQVSTFTIRDYINLLRKNKDYSDRIKAVSYNDEGLITLLFMIRESP